MAAAVDFKVLEKIYFQWDEPVDYLINDDVHLSIYPVMVKDSELFLACYDVISIDKDNIPDPKIISMPYLNFMADNLFKEQICIDKFVSLLRICLHWDNARITVDENGFYYLENMDGSIRIDAKKFNEIRRIILYQNIIGYDDEYINPELKAAMAESDALRNRGIEFPSMERKMAIISSHTGITKKEQMEMTYRAHSLLFREVSGEVDFLASWPIFLYAGEANKHDHWIYKKAKGKLDGYITGVNEFAGKIGANPNAIKQTSRDNGLDNMFNNFNK